MSDDTKTRVERLQRLGLCVLYSDAIKANRQDLADERAEALKVVEGVKFAASNNSTKYVVQRIVEALKEWSDERGKR
jgi:hypothetical protein